LAPVGYEAAIETGTTVQHHTAIDSAAALHSDLDRLLAALGALTPFNTSSLTAAASTRSHCQRLRTNRETNAPRGAASLQRKSYALL